MKNKIVLLVVIKLLLVTLSFAQNPKHYIAQFEHSTSNPITVYSIDLVTGQKEILFSEEHKIYNPIVLPDQSRIFYITEGNTCVYNTETQTIDTLSHLDYIVKFENISFIPATNEICLSFVKEDAEYNSEYQVFESTSISIDKDTYTIIDSSIGCPGTVRSVLSRNGDKEYQLKERTDGIWFGSFNIRTFEYDSLAIEGFENLQLSYPPRFIAANNGYVFSNYYIETERLAHYIVLNPEEGKSIFYGQNIKTFGLPPFPISVSNDGNMIWQDKDNFYVLSHETGKLRKRLKFHFNEPTTDTHVLDMIKKAKLLILGDTLYYFPKNPDDWEYSQLWTFEVGRDNINENQTDMELLDMLVEDPNELYQNGWILNESTKDQYNTFLGNAKSYLAHGDTASTILELEKVLTECHNDSSTAITIEAYALLYFNAKELFDRLPETQTYPYLKVNFKDSQGNFILNGSLQYYDSGWKDAVNNGDGTFNVETQKEKVSLRMSYEGAFQQLDNVTVKQNTVTFSTIKQLLNC